MKTVALILSYNNPSMTDRLVENIMSVFKKELLIIVLDNGSDSDKISKYTTHKIEVNCRMTRGFNEGIKIINSSTAYSDYDNIWFFTNDCYFINKDEQCPLTIAESYLTKYPEIGILHPSENHDVKVCFDVKHDTNIHGLKSIIEYDMVCPIFTRKAIDAMGGFFNNDLYQGWGIDHESSYLIRKAGLLVCINHESIIGHDTSSTYDRGLDKLHNNRDSYYAAAYKEMWDVLSIRYGYNWHQIFTETYNENNGKILN